VIRSIEMGDRADIAVALVCALHCVAAPLVGASMQVAAPLPRSELSSYS
jgi:hypothetical protein